MQAAGIAGLLLAAAVSGQVAQKDGYMNCGDAPLCGVLTLETGLGPGAYKHDYVSVHGLWPETGSYGSSKCIAPSSSKSDPSDVYECYDHPGGSGMSPISFEKHEWDKHGRCAGVADADDFFKQLCSLSSPPLKVMDAARKAGHVDLPGYVSRLTAAGFAVFSTDTHNKQVLLSACAAADGRWKLADVKDFGKACPGSGPTPGPTPTPPTPTPAGRCERGKHGPPCQRDDDCASVTSCLRCAKSGYCTDQPKL